MILVILISLSLDSAIFPHLVLVFLKIIFD